jgi:hypothetical protein
MKLSLWLAIFIAFYSCVWQCVSADEATLKFFRGSRQIKELSLHQLTEHAKPQTIQLFDPIYKKKKRYRCLPISEVMKTAFGANWEEFKENEVVLKATDGYSTFMDAWKLGEDGGYLAFADVDVPGWEPVDRRRANPGPFYLFWTKPEQISGNDYAWPWGLTTRDLRIINCPMLRLA